MDELTTELDKLIAEEEAVQVPPPQDAENNKVAELDAKRRHWREKALKMAERIKELESKVPAPEVKASDTDSLKEDVATLRLAQKGLDEEAISFVKAYAKGKGTDAATALEDEAIKSFLELRKQKQSLESAIPAPSNRTVSVQGKTLTEMSPAERKANWGQIIDSARKK